MGVVLKLLVTQWCLALWDPMDCSPPGSPVPGILQVFPSPQDLPDPGIEPRSPALQIGSLSSQPLGNFTNEKADANSC